MNNAQLLEITQMQANDYTPSGSVDGKKKSNKCRKISEIIIYKKLN